MAVGKGSDFVINHAAFYAGQYEVVAQNLAAFNGASNNALVLTAASIIGDYEKESFIQTISSLITRRDLTSIADVTDLAMTMDEFIGVKINRKIGPTGQTLDSWKKIGETSEEFSFVLGRMIAEEKLKDQVNTTIKAVQAALSGQSNLLYDNTPNTTKTMNHLALNDGRALFGDAAGNIVAWIMHSKAYFDLVGYTIENNIFDAAGVAVKTGTAATMGKPVVVIDAPALKDASGETTYYYTLGLVPGGAMTTESEPDSIVLKEITGKEQLFMRLQGEFSYNIKCRGFQWDVSNGGANPTDSSVATGTNWDKIATDDKHLAGVLIKSE